MTNPTPNVELLNPYLTATYQICEAVLGESPTKNNLSALAMAGTNQPVNTVIGVTGAGDGYVIIGISYQAVFSIASHMMGEATKVFSPTVASAIGELANMICGRALTQILEAGYCCDITPPTIIRGSNVQIATPAIPAIVVPLVLSHGEITLTIALQPR